MQDECYSILFRKKLYTTLEQLQVDVDEWGSSYNQDRPHSGGYCYGKTPWQTFLESKRMASEKDLSRAHSGSDSETIQPIPVR